MALESLNAFWTLERWRREKTSKAIFSSSSDWHLISSFSLSCKRLWWEQETKVQPFAVKYCVNKTKRDCYSFFFCQCPASERVSRTVKWSCTVLFLFSYTPWILPIDVKNNGSFYMPAGNHQIDFPWALYRFKKKKLNKAYANLQRNVRTDIFVILMIFVVPAFSHTYAARLQTSIKICQRLDILSNIAVLSFLLVFVLSKNRCCHFGFGFLM